MTAKTMTNKWLMTQKPNASARLRLFCFPYAGGSSVVFNNWSESLPGRIEVCAVRLPGRESRLGEPPFKRFEPLVDVLSDALTPYMDKPFAFFGHSMGGLLSFELARRLQRDRKPGPLQLIVSGCAGPKEPLDEPPFYDLPEPEFIDELRRLDGTPKEVLDHPELMALLIPLLRADFELCQTYTYTDGPPLECPITAFGGIEDIEITREKLESWRDQTTSTFLLHLLPGDHFFLNKSRPMLLRLVSTQLSRLLDELA